MNLLRSGLGDLAILGGAPTFNRPLPVGQLYFPCWEEYETAFRDIFVRQYYTNQGPLVQEFERALQAFFGVRNVICVTNATIGLIMTAEALGLKGKIITPSFTFIATAQALEWAGLYPVFCDVDRTTHHVTPKTIEDQLIEDQLDGEVSGILAVNLWGGSCDLSALQALADERELQLFYDSAHAFGCKVNDTLTGRFGAAEVFSFHATKVVSSAEGGCVTTNDDDLAKKLRNIRSSYGAGPPVHVVKTSNGRMSEAQAAIGLVSLDNFSNVVALNEELFGLYRNGLADIDGLRVLEPVNVNRSNFQYAVVEVDEVEFGLSRDLLLEVLRAENVLARRYFFPGAHRCVPWVNRKSVAALPNTDRLCRTLIQLPIGAFMSNCDVETLCTLLGVIRERAADVKKRC
jgi:dTDP-4-amino-4,6-dideoxygalactose transaminase